MAQLEDYDESFYLTKFIFVLRPPILPEMFVQRPETLLEARRIAEELQLTHTMVKMHQTNEKEKTTKLLSIEAPKRGGLKGCINQFS